MLLVFSMEISPCMLDNVVSVANDGAFGTYKCIKCYSSKADCYSHFCYVGFIFQYFMFAILGWYIRYQESSIEINSSIEKI